MNEVSSSILHSVYKLHEGILYSCIRNTAETDGEPEVTLSMVLNFFTGSDAVPPCGYANPPELNYSPCNVMPTASACAPSLTLPTKYSDYEEFKSNLIKGITWHGGFGLY